MAFKMIPRRRVYVLVFIMNLIISSVRAFRFAEFPWTFHLVFFIGGLLVIGLFWEVILWIGAWLEKVLPINQRPEVRIPTQVFLSFLASSVLGGTLSVMSMVFYGIKPVDLMNPAPHLFNLLCATVFNLLYFGSFYFQQWKENLTRTERLQREHAQVRYDVLKNQLNPHFLFNALASLNSLIFENQQLASDFLKQLSKVYRYTLQNRDQEVVSLRAEMDFIQHFISLLQTRFSSALIFSIEIDQNELEKGIVPVTTQMLIENAVKHNIMSPNQPLEISIRTDNGYLVMSNTLNRKSQVETSNRLGLENLKTLYQYLNPNPLEVLEDESHFSVRVPLI